MRRWSALVRSASAKMWYVASAAEKGVRDGVNLIPQWSRGSRRRYDDWVSASAGLGGHLPNTCSKESSAKRCNTWTPLPPKKTRLNFNYVVGSVNILGGSGPAVPRQSGDVHHGRARTMTANQPSSPATVRVMVLADIRLYREGLARLLARHSSLTVVAAGPVNEDSLFRVHQEGIDVLLLEAATACETYVIQNLALLAPKSKWLFTACLMKSGRRCAAPKPAPRPS